MRGLRKVGAVLALTFAFTGVAASANAAPAEAATIIYGDCYRWYNGYRELQRTCWVDYAWYEFKRDCYCYTVPVVCTRYGCT